MIVLRFFVLALAALVFSSSGALLAQAKASILLESSNGVGLEFATQGASQQFRTAGAKVSKLKVTYRPGSKTSKSVELTSQTAGVFAWTPTSPGLVTVAAHVEGQAKALVTKNFSVRFAEGSVLGIFVMLFAAILLFGGAAISIRALLRADA